MPRWPFTSVGSAHGGSFERDESRILLDSLDPCGMFLTIMGRDLKETGALRSLLGL